MLGAWRDVIAAALGRGGDWLVVDPSPPPAGCVYASVPKLLLALRGRHPMTIRDGERIRRRSLAAGMGAYVRPGGWHRQERGRPRIYASLNLHPDYLHLHLREHDGRGLATGPAHRWHRRRGVDAVHDRAAEALAAATDDGDVTTVADLARVVWRRALLAFDEQASDPRWLAIRAHIDAYVHEPLTRASVATACGLHPSTLSELARRATGRRFIDVLTEARMQHAARLLREHGLGVAATAEALGFCDVRHFRRVFTRAFGHPPSRRP